MEQQIWKDISSISEEAETQTTPDNSWSACEVPRGLLTGNPTPTPSKLVLPVLILQMRKLRHRGVISCPQEHGWDELALGPSTPAPTPRGSHSCFNCSPHHHCPPSGQVLGGRRLHCSALPRNVTASPSHKVLAVHSCGSLGPLDKCPLTQAGRREGQEWRQVESTQLKFLRDSMESF
jgi:hypothetical protein